MSLDSSRSVIEIHRASTPMNRLSQCLIAATLAAAASVAGAQTTVEAADHSCSVLEDKIREAGKLRVNAKTHNPHGNERVSERTFISPAARCDFFDEVPTLWRVYAAGGEICQGTHVCLQRPTLGAN